VLPEIVGRKLQIGPSPRRLKRQNSLREATGSHDRQVSNSRYVPLALALPLSQRKIKFRLDRKYIRRVLFPLTRFTFQLSFAPARICESVSFC
jgi:hypothetical protein